MSTQPYLFDLVTCVDAPSVVLSGADGQIREGGVQGWLCADRRLLSRLRLTVDEHEPAGLRSELADARGAAFTAVVSHTTQPTHDPTLAVERHRTLGHDTLTESVTVRSSARRETTLRLAVEAAADFSTMAEVRTSRPAAPAHPIADGDTLRWVHDDVCVDLEAEPAADSVTVDDGVGTLSWALRLEPGAVATVRLRAHVTGRLPLVFPGADSVPWQRPAVECADWRLAEVVHRGLDDLEGLLLRDAAGDDVFTAAGSPWFLTLFGRDSLWTARMLLPLGTRLAMGTLRTLARRQGSHRDPLTEEQPGRILHEVRHDTLALSGITLPPTYYGTADATPLFVVLLAEAWRWGADAAEVEALLPAVQDCLHWLAEEAGDGFIRYVDTTGSGLSNQGWKDSEDGIVWADGSLARPPIALSEVQAYAFQAATLGADLLEAHGLTGASRWRSWARALAERFRDAFWVADAHGRYPAVALDADGAPVDSVASNMGHLLGTGLLAAPERDLVARRLVASGLGSGFGLRTLSSDSRAYSPLSYHCGSVWPHDTAIAAMGLARDGFVREAQSLLHGLVRAAPHFAFRLPELYGGDAVADAASPLPYPSACRPQAWAAAAPVAALAAVLGLHVDVPGGVVSARPGVTAPLLPLTVSGLRVGSHDLAVAVDADGRPQVSTDHPGLTVTAAAG